MCLGLLSSVVLSSMINVVEGSELPFAPSGMGKEHLVYPSTSDYFEESDTSFPPLVIPVWHSRPYPLPLLVEELMTQSLFVPRYMKVNMIVLHMSHGLTMLTALDASELKHDSKLKSAKTRLRGLGNELAAKKKKLSELQTITRCAHSQFKIFEARVKTLEDEIASRHATIAEFR